MVASLNHASRAQLCEQRDELINKSVPVVLTPGNRLFHEKSSDQNTYVVTYLPEYCDVPAGLFWPIGTTYEDFLQSIRGRGRNQPYNRFCKLLEMRKDYFVQWFNNAKNESDKFGVIMNPAEQLFTNLIPNLQGGELDVFHLLREQYLWKLHCDSLKFQVSTRLPVEGEERDAFMYFLREIDLLYPSVLGTKISSDRQAYIGQIFTVESPWDTKGWLAPFRLPTNAIPALIKRFGQHEVSMDPNDNAPRVRLELPPSLTPPKSRFASAFK